ncbi:AAA family ATPase [Paraglaciecola sp.]|uniref:AAA family ATPase n=1 Tax=Paraglaciecola sp. TaxID=1920173 RepID=UPI0030F39D62
MSTKTYRKVFADYQQGYLSAFSILRQPLAQKSDVILSTEDHSKLLDCIANAMKGQVMTMLLASHSKNNKSLIINSIAKQSNKELCVIDCVQLTNKYIGETEKNLARIIADAHTHDWILFFDEADALFGKLTNNVTRHDSYANQEVSYLFKLLSQHAGLYVLAVSDTALCELLQHRVAYCLKSLQG